MPAAKEKPSPANANAGDGQSLRNVGLLALAAALLSFIAQPPISFLPAAFLATIPWLSVAAIDKPLPKRGYLCIYASGWLLWMALLESLRHAHPAMLAGWFALASYLAIYSVLLVGLVRVAVHRYRIPTAIAAIVVGVGLEAIRGYVITGFSGALLGHALANWPLAIQSADLGGSYAVSAVLYATHGAVAAWVAIPASSRRRTNDGWISGLIAIGLIAGNFIYGSIRQQQVQASIDAANPADARTVALLQGNAPIEYREDPERDVAIFDRYARLTAQAAEQGARMIVWPESMYTGGIPYYVVASDAKAPVETELSDDEFRARLVDAQRLFQSRTASLFRGIRNGQAIDVIAGCTAVDFRRDGYRQTGSGLWLDATATVRGRYDKQHLVMFGEYIPLGDWFPLVYQLGLMPQGTVAGESAVGFEIDGIVFSPSICFELVTERVMQRSFAALANVGQTPDVLVNITNDAWFDGGGVVGIHRGCGILNAVALRRPLLVSGNGGPTMWVEATGQVKREAAFDSDEVVLAKVNQSTARSIYQSVGDWPALLLAAITVGLALSGYRWRRQHHLGNRSPSSSPIQE
jgi:apolipoprotein N-acyltransferase